MLNKALTEYMTLRPICICMTMPLTKIKIIKAIQKSTVLLLMHVYRNAHFSDETCYPRGLRKAGCT